MTNTLTPSVPSVSVIFGRTGVVVGRTGMIAVRILSIYTGNPQDFLPCWLDG